MTMSEEYDALSTTNVDTDISRVDVSAVAVLARSETEAQLDAAHKYPRSIGRFLKEAVALATLTQEVAESCIYAVPRDGKSITGPSVRLAEIVASAYGNLHVGARILGAEEKEIVSQGVAWDLEKNLRATVESRRRITGKTGKRYNDDMITMTGNAAASIALRNAIFRVVPGAYVKAIYAKVKEVAVGTAQTLGAKRGAVVERLGKMGVTPDRVLARVEKATVEDIGLAELETLIGLGTAVKNGDATIDDAFPDPKANGGTKETADLEPKLRAEKPKAEKYAKKEKPDAPTKDEPKAAASEPQREPAATSTPAPGPGTFPPCIVCGKQLGANDAIKADPRTPGGPPQWRHSKCERQVDPEEPPFGALESDREPGDDA